MFGDMNLLNQKQKEIDSKLAAMELSASAAQGRVQVKANGKGVIQDLTIDANLVAEGDTEAIEDFVLLSMNEIKKKVDETQLRESKDLLSGLLPGM